MLRNVVPLFALGLTGCWISTQEWGDKRLEAAQQAPLSPSGPGVPDLGLGTCVQRLFEGAADGISTDGSNNQQPTCTEGAGPDVSFAWEVRDEGCWVLSTAGSSFTPVLYGRDACTGNTLFCTDENVVITHLSAGPTLIVVDGYGANDSGEWKLDASSLITVDLGTDTQTAGNTNGRSTWEEGTCGAQRSGAAEYIRFTPPQAGVWQFSLDTAYDGVLSVHQACDFDQSLACIDDSDASNESLMLELGALQEVIVRVGGVWPSGASAPEQGGWSLDIALQ